MTLCDLDLTLTTMKNVVALIEDVSPDYLKVLDLSSLTTLVLENFCPNAGVRAMTCLWKNSMPTNNQQLYEKT